MVTAPKEHMSTQNNDARLVRLETNYEQLVKGQSSLETEVHNLGDRIDRGLSRIADDISTRSRPQWSLLIMGASFLVTLLSLVGMAMFAFSNLSVSKLAESTNARFREVETEFVSARSREQLEIDHNKAALARSTDEADKLRGRVDEAEKTIAKNTQRLDDHVEHASK